MLSYHTALPFVSKMPLNNCSMQTVTHALLQVAGLDVGWGQQIDLEYNSERHRHEVTRHLPPGRYPYKFIMDGHWTYSADHPTFTVSSLTQHCSANDHLKGCICQVCMVERGVQDQDMLGACSRYRPAQ